MEVVSGQFVELCALYFVLCALYFEVYLKSALLVYLDIQSTKYKAQSTKVKVEGAN